MSYSISGDTKQTIMHTEFFPSVAWLSFAEKQRNITIEVYEKFPKQTYRNRVLLMSAGGLQSISVPIKRKSTQILLTKDAEISYKENWNIRLWRAIYSNYGKSPFFEYFASEIEILLRKKYKFLLDLNTATFLFLKKSFSLSCDISFSSAYIDQRENNFKDNFQVKDRHKTGINFPVYIQCFYDKIPFECNLSALDLLLCLGKQEGKTYMDNLSFSL